jgi:hypothetical protein
MREGFVASGEVDHLHLVALTWIRHVQSREELTHGDVDLDNFELLARSRRVAHFVRRS